jgi:hypothetical protein
MSSIVNAFILTVGLSSPAVKDPPVETIEPPTPPAACQLTKDAVLAKADDIIANNPGEYTQRVYTEQETQELLRVINEGDKSQPDIVADQITIMSQVNSQQSHVAFIVNGCVTRVIQVPTGLWDQAVTEAGIL